MQFTDIYDTEKLASIIDTVAARLATMELDTIVGTGLSGAVVVPMVAVRLGKRFAIVRKEPSKHDSIVEGDISGRAVIVDDWVASGDTIRAILAYCNDCVGVYLYAYPSDTKGLGGYTIFKETGLSVLN